MGRVCLSSAACCNSGERAKCLDLYWIDMIQSPDYKTEYILVGICDVHKNYNSERNFFIVV